MGDTMTNFGQGTRHILNDESQLAYIYSHLVCESKFALPPITLNVRGNHPTFKLSVDTF
jgi:hypothetical protein